MAHWQAGWYMFLEYPWLGVGPGNYAIVYENYHLPGWFDPLGHAHNYYLNLAAEAGGLGLAGFLLVGILAFRAAVRGLQAAEPFWATLSLGILGSFVGITLHSGFDNLFVHGVSVQVGMLMGLAQVAAERPRRTAAEPWTARLQTVRGLRPGPSAPTRGAAGYPHG
jgi:O-antigen ligase